MNIHHRLPWFWETSSVEQNKYFRHRNFSPWFELKKLSTVTFIPAFLNAITFLIVIFPWWVVMFLDFHRTVFTFLSWFDLLGVVLARWISIQNIFKSLRIYWHRAKDITSFEKHLESSSVHILSFCKHLSFQEYISEGISHLVFYGDLDFKLRRIKGTVNFVSSGSKIVKRLRRRNMTQWSSRGRYVLYLVLLQHCPNLY